jgi:hypothetical protein
MSNAQGLVADADDLPAPPAVFEPDAQYRIRLNRVVPGPAPLRPNSVAQVLGSYAESIRDAISGAKKIG